MLEPGKILARRDLELAQFVLLKWAEQDSSILALYEQETGPDPFMSFNFRDLR